MRKVCIVLVLLAIGNIATVPKAEAQLPILEVVKTAAKKAIKAIDLKIQRQQNKVIWLQVAQKTLENTMSKTRLTEIADWVDKQEKLYREYYEELNKVKAVIAYYRRIREITEKQVQLVEEYRHAWRLFQQDGEFTADELDYMGRVYVGILDESVKNLDQLFLVVNSFQTQMSDAKRLEIINAVADRLDTNYDDLKAFNRQNAIVGIQRARAASDIESVQRLYGLE